MREKIKNIQERINQDPKIRESVGRIKPERNFWGISGIVLFFFLPELVTFLWQDELVSWAHLHSITESSSSLRWIFTQFEEMFASGVSWVNIILGSLLLWWTLKGTTDNRWYS